MWVPSVREGPTPANVEVASRLLTRLGPPLRRPEPCDAGVRQSAAAKAGTEGVTVAPCSRLGSQLSQRGRYQFQSPSSFIVAGSRTARTIVASMSTAAASPMPRFLHAEDRQGGEDREHTDVDDRCACDDTGRGLDPVGDRVLGCQAAVECLPHAAEDEDVTALNAFAITFEGLMEINVN
jgi:hypothetical protein